MPVPTNFTQKISGHRQKKRELPAMAAERRQSSTLGANRPTKQVPQEITQAIKDNEETIRQLQRQLLRTAAQLRQRGTLGAASIAAPNKIKQKTSNIDAAETALEQAIKRINYRIPTPPNSSAAETMKISKLNSMLFHWYEGRSGFGGQLLAILGRAFHWRGYQEKNGLINNALTQAREKPIKINYRIPTPPNSSEANTKDFNTLNNMLFHWYEGRRGFWGQLLAILGHAFHWRGYQEKNGLINTEVKTYLQAHFEQTESPSSHSSPTCTTSIHIIRSEQAASHPQKPPINHKSAGPVKRY